MRLYVATTNAGKLRDFAAAAESFGTEIVPLPGIAQIAAPEETEETFEGNARLKATFYSIHAPGLFVLADDSGLEVDALDGRPGVRSARFAQDVGLMDTAAGLDGSNNDALLLAMLEEVDRTARYRCALVVARDGVVERVSSGTVEGAILSEPEGENGFGYDPLFRIAGLDRTMAQIPMADRLRFSHRARALRALLAEWAPS